MQRGRGKPLNHIHFDHLHPLLLATSMVVSPLAQELEQRWRFRLQTARLIRLVAPKPEARHVSWAKVFGAPD